MCIRDRFSAGIEPDGVLDLFALFMAKAHQAGRQGAGGGPHRAPAGLSRAIVAGVAIDCGAVAAGRSATAERIPFRLGSGRRLRTQFGTAGCRTERFERLRQCTADSGLLIQGGSGGRGVALAGLSTGRGHPASVDLSLIHI